MTVSNPSAYRDKSTDWYSYFDAFRRREVLSLITEALIHEHEQNPLGYRAFHSPELQRVLNYFRTRPVLGKYYVYAEEPWEEYRLAIVVARGEAPDILDSPVFQTEQEAMHGVFMRRVEELRVEP